MAGAADIEGLGSFYLGRGLAPDGEPGTEPLLYAARDLTTHAVCLGMTGSGKTGLCVSLLEEAAIDGIPAIAIDPKGDLGNLLLSFPSLSPAEFRPWIDETEAERAGTTPDAHAREMAERWQRGLAEWGQDGDRIRRLHERTDLALYTPGSRKGRPLSVLRSLAAPSSGPGDDPDAFQEHVASAASGILSLVGVEADPLSSREHILLVKLIEAAWTEGRDLDLPELIRSVQKPPFERVGVFDLESFFPAKDRLALAMRLNHLLASPGFSAWTEGEPLEIERLLYTPEGKPRLSVLSIAHLDDHERMFFVTWLLGEVVAWMRRQSGTQSLRALLYLDEVMGFLPPVAEPPSKAPLLTLMKQARAFGVGVVLATQNPIDLDYKALSNAGTWFLGRLQTERDQARLLDGLEGSAAARGGGFERKEMERQLAGMGKRVFLLHSVHQKRPVLFHTRWALSYLRGPLTLQEIARLQPEAAAVAPAPREASVATPGEASVPAPREVPAKPIEARPALPTGLSERFLSVDGTPPEGAQLLYRPALLGSAQVRYADKRMGIDHYVDVTLLAEPEKKAGFDDALEVDTTSWGLAPEPGRGARFAKLPSGLGKGSPARLERALRAHLQRTRPLTLARCKPLRLVAELGEAEGAFRVRVRDAQRELRDAKLEKLEKKWAPRLARAERRITSRAQAVERQREQRSGAVMGTAISVGATVLGALFGRKVGVGTVGRAATAARSASRTAREQGDVSRAEEQLAQAQEELEELEARFQEALAEVRDAAADPELEELTLRPRRGDTRVREVALVWRPYWLGADGLPRPAFRESA
jgi:hypothetical protein